MKLLGGCLLFLCLWGGSSSAAEINLATLNCAKYQNELVGPGAPTPTPDPINTMMWLFGYSVGKSGGHVMYGEALAPFGFALDAECKSNPIESLMDALAAVKPNSKNPMDLSTLQCATFAARHVELARTEAESANTIMMWLFGFSVGTSGSHIFDASGRDAFGSALLADCTKYPQRSLYDELRAVKFTKVTSQQVVASPRSGPRSRFAALRDHHSAARGSPETPAQFGRALLPVPETPQGIRWPCERPRQC